MVTPWAPFCAQEERTYANGKENALREQIGKILADGLKTQTEPFPENNTQFSALLAELKDLDPNDLKSKLVLSGFTDTPYGEDQRRCQECMYYLVHRKWCDLPELAVPVEPTGGAGCGAFKLRAYP